MSKGFFTFVNNALIVKKSFFSLIFLSLFFLNRSSATHIVGGEMNYKYLGPNQYEVTMTVYRDCFNGVAPFDDPAHIGVYDDNNNLVDAIDVFIYSQGQVPNAINSPCLTPPSNVCYEVAKYIFTLNVPSGSSAYTIAYQRCCRNHSIMNIVNPGGTGATYSATITDGDIVPVNSNPVFNSWPPTFICANAPFTFDHSATDLDGDSLVYELSYPLAGADSSLPVPNPPPSPPYQPITFLNPYGVNDPLGGIPMQIDPQTGILKATPDMLGQYVYGVTVKEYRNGVYIGETRRDFQVNVVTCPQITVASIFSPVIACGSLNAHFTNNSYNALAYEWDFGDTATATDTSTLHNPIYSYPDTGNYTVTLIAHSGINVACDDTASGIVHVYPVFTAQYLVSNQHCSNEFDFFDYSYGVGGPPNFWQWDFGDSTTSSLSSDVHFYQHPGEYEVTLVSSTDSACTDTLKQKVYVLQNPVADFSTSLDTCNFELKISDSSEFAFEHHWILGDGITETFIEGDHHYLNPGTYDVKLIVNTDSLCYDSLLVHLVIPPLPEAGFGYSVGVCDSNVQFSNQSVYAHTYEWDFGDDSLSYVESPLHAYSISGYVPVSLKATSLYGCEDVISKDIFFVSFKNSDFGFSVDSCSGIVSFNDITKGSAEYYWDFGDGSVSHEMNPVHRYPKNGEYLISLILNRETPCYDSAALMINYESPLGEVLFIPNTFTPNGDGLNDFFTPSLFRPCDTYELTIFNRWGEKVFESNDVAHMEWDGRYKGEPMPDDVYVYLLTGNGMYRNGTISIIR